MITYKFTNAAGVDIEVLTDGQGDATNELHVVEIRGIEESDVKGGFKFDIYPYNEVEFEIFAKANNLTLRKIEDENEATESPMYEETARELAYTKADTVANITPTTVTFSASKFTIPGDVVAFTFTDDGKTFEVEFDGWFWNFEWEWLPFTVAYTEVTAVDDITPGSITYADGNFTVPYGTTEFTFTDDGKTFGATLSGGTWSIAEVVVIP